VAWGEREGEDGAVNLEGRRLGEALTDEGEWRRGSGEVQRGPESFGRWRWAGGSRGCRGACSTAEEERRGRKRNWVRRAAARPFYTGARRWETGDGGGTTWQTGTEREGGVPPDRRTVPYRQRPEAGGHGRGGAAMPRGRWPEQGRGRADRWATAIASGRTVPCLNKF
jgi:hypothetical protein